MARRRRELKLRKTDYIFSEGETERIYFDRVRRAYKKNISVKMINGKKQSLDLVNHVISYFNNRSKEELSKVGCVYIAFDKDDEDITTIAEAYKLALKHDYKIIFTNECFDLWILAHFDDFTDKYLTRREVYRLLDDKFSVANYTDHKANEATFKKVLTDEVIINTIHNHNNDKWLSSRNYTNNPYSNVAIKMHKLFIL